MKTYLLLTLIATAGLGQVTTNTKLAKRVYELEKEVRILRNYYDANAGTEYGMYQQEEDWVTVMRDFNRRLNKCCP